MGRLVSSGYAHLGEDRGPLSSIVTLTLAGETAYEAIVGEAQRRDEILLADLGRDERSALDAVADRMMKNALDLLARERSALDG